MRVGGTRYLAIMSRGNVRENVHRAGCYTAPDAVVHSEALLAGGAALVDKLFGPHEHALGGLQNSVFTNGTHGRHANFKRGTIQ